MNINNNLNNLNSIQNTTKTSATTETKDVASKTTSLASKAKTTEALVDNGKDFVNAKATGGQRCDSSINETFRDICNALVVNLFATSNISQK